MFIVWVVPLYFPDMVAYTVLLLSGWVALIGVPCGRDWLVEMWYVPGLTKPTVWTFWFHVGTGVGGVVGGNVVRTVVMSEYTTRGVTFTEGTGVAKVRPVLTGSPVAIGLMTNAITRMMQNAAMIYVMSFLSMYAVFFYSSVHT